MRETEEIPLNEPSVRRSTCCGSTIYDPAITFVKRTSKAAIVFLSVFLISSAAWSQANVFTGTGNWTDAARWSTGVAPNNASADVRIEGNCTLTDVRSIQNIEIAPGGVLNGSGSSAYLALHGNWTNKGTFNAGTSTVNLQGSSSVAVLSGTTNFYNLHATGAGKAGLTITAGDTIAVANQNTINLSGNFTIGAGSVFTAAAVASTISTGGNWINNGTFSVRATTVRFNGTTSPATVTGSSATTFNHVIIDKSGASFNAPATFILNGNLTVNAGTYNNGTTTTIRWNLILSSGIFNASNTITIAGDANLNGGTFNANAATINVGGTFTDGAATFNAGTSTIRLIGSTIPPLIATLSANEPFNNVVISKSTGFVQPAANITVNNLTLSSTNATAGLAFENNNAVINVSNNLTVSSGGLRMFNASAPNTQLVVAGGVTMTGGAINVATTSSQFIINNGLTFSGGTITIGGQSKLKVAGTAAISGTGLLTTTTVIPVEFENVSLSGVGPGFRFNSTASNISVTGNWESALNNFRTDGTTTSNVTFIGSTNTTITGNAQFANVTIRKDASRTVTNSSANFLIARDLLVSTGTLILTDKGDPDMNVRGNITIVDGASLDMGSYQNINVALGGNLIDNNTLEPSAPVLDGSYLTINYFVPVNISAVRRGLYIGSGVPDAPEYYPMGNRPCSNSNIYKRPQISLRNTITFDGSGEQSITGRLSKIRSYCNGEIALSAGQFGMALPNIVVNKPAETLRLNSGMTVRVHGDITINRGGLSLNEQTMYFGDESNDEILINPNGVFEAPKNSKLFMNTGGNEYGTFLKVNGGKLRLIGTGSYPVIITREGTQGQYYRMAAYSGTVEAIYTTISYQGVSNEGFAAEPDPSRADWDKNKSDGGFKIYSAAVIDPENKGYNFSYCVLGANAANRTTSLTINTGQNLDIVGTIFNTSGSGGVNCANNNNVAGAGIITFYASSGELGGVNGEVNDGGHNDDAGIVWRTFNNIYWVGNTYPGHSGSATAWSNPRNWSFSQTGNLNPWNIFPGKTDISNLGILGSKFDPDGQSGSIPDTTSVTPDVLQKFEVFICASATSSPVIDGNYTIKGTLVINSTGKNSMHDLSPVVATNYGKTLMLGNNTLEVWGDLVNNARKPVTPEAPNPTNMDGGKKGIVDVTGGGKIRFRSNFASFHQNNAILLNSSANFILEAFGGGSLQEIKVARNALQELVIDKPEGRLVVQGFGTDRFDVLKGLHIKSGGMELLTSTPMLVNDDFKITSGFFTFNGSTIVVRGNWENIGGTINTGAGVVNFYPKDNSPKTIRSGGQAFNVINFGLVNNSFNKTILSPLPAAPTSPANPGKTQYTLVDDFTAVGLTTVAARGEISGNEPSITYTDDIGAAQIRTVIAGPNTKVQLAGLRIRENGVFTVSDGAALYISNNSTHFGISQSNPFPSSIGYIGILVEQGASVATNGVINVLGKPTNYAKITRKDVTGSFRFKVNGTISCRYYLMEFMDLSGIDLTGTQSLVQAPPDQLNPTQRATKKGGPPLIGNLPGGGSSNPFVSSFSDGILTNGATGGAYISYRNNAQVFGVAPDTIFNASFPVSLGVGGFNIVRTTTGTNSNCAPNSGVLWFRDATGAFAGEDFDNDGGSCSAGQIQWKQPVIKRWDGGANTAYWHDANNWFPDGVPAPTDDVVLDRVRKDAAYTVIINSTTGPIEVNSLTIDNEDSPTPSSGKTIELSIVDGIDLKIKRSYTVKAADTKQNVAVLRLGPGSDIQIGETWSNRGTFYNGGGTVSFGSTDASAYRGTRVIFNYPIPANNSYNVFFNVKMLSGRTELNSDMVVNNDLLVGTGAKLDASSQELRQNTIFITGNWLNNGRFIPQQGTVAFVGSNPQTITQTDTVENFFNLRIEKPANDVELYSRATVGDYYRGGGGLYLNRGRFISSTGKELIMMTDNIQRDDLGAPATTAYVKGPLGQLFRGIGNITLPYVLGDKRYPQKPANLTLSLTDTDFFKGTVFTMEQIDADPDPGTTEDRQIPAPLNMVSENRYWKVKNIMFPATSPVNNKNADFNKGKIELPFDRFYEQVETYDGQKSLDLLIAMMQVAEVSIVKDSANGGHNNAAPFTIAEQYKRGLALEGSEWKDLGGIIDASNNGATPLSTTSPSIISDFFTELGNGDFTFSWNFASLPTQLTKFNAEIVKETVEVKWAVTTEKDSKHYLVQRSENGKDFKAIGKIDIAVTSSGPKSYKFTDKAPFKGTNYYRLATVDMNGSISYSQVAAANFTPSALEIVAFPNPFDGKRFQVDFLSESDGQVKITLYNIVGVPVYSKVVDKNSATRIEVELEHQLAKGTYILQVVTGKRSVNKKLIVK